MTYINNPVCIIDKDKIIPNQHFHMRNGLNSTSNNFKSFRKTIKSTCVHIYFIEICERVIEKQTQKIHFGCNLIIEFQFKKGINQKVISQIMKLI